MAPQQNSTFIDDDTFLRSKLHSNEAIKHDAEKEEEEIIKRYSPILPPINAQFNECEREDCNASDMPVHEKFKPQTKKKEKYIRTNELNDVPQKYRQNCNNLHLNGKEKGKGKENGNGNGNYLSHAVQSGQSGGRRSRSISLHGVNSTMDQGQKEITIWIDDEPRYVSGVTKKTTCSDIVKALIDDEIQNGNYAFLKRISKQRMPSKDGGDGNDGGDGVCATSRDYSDYVITESWRGIERSYDSNMTILPVWKAWSRVHNELRLRLRHRCDIRDPLQNVKPCARQSFLRKFLSKFTRLWRKEKHERKGSSKKCAELKENCLLLSNKADIPDELLFVILPDKVYEKERLQSIPENPAQKYHHNSRPQSLPKRKASACRKKHERERVRERERERGVSGVNANNNCIRRRPLTTVSNSMRNTVRYRLAQKTSEMDALYTREYALTRELSEKCKLYRLQNQIYSNPDQQWNISIGQVQRKIENYAKEIVRTEHELLELKNEIRQDISLINNLKRMTLERGGGKRNGNSGGGGGEQKKSTTCQQESTTFACSAQESEGEGELKPNSEMQFVDNIYEFCDNNASMLV